MSIFFRNAWTRSLVAATVASVMVAAFSGSSDATQRRSTGTTWTQRFSLAGGDQLNAISCPTNLDCVAVGNEAASTTNGGTTWSRWANVKSTGQFDAVTCPSPTFCMATGGFSSILTEGDSVFTSTTLGRSWKEVGFDGENQRAHCHARARDSALISRTQRSQRARMGAIRRASVSFATARWRQLRRARLGHLRECNELHRERRGRTYVWHLG